MQDTRPLLLASDFPKITRKRIDTLQVNLGYLCNMSCVHCHVNAGPGRTEQMNADTAGEVLALLDRLDIATLDLTGGAPELNPQFRRLVEGARKQGVHVIDRCNLTVLLEPGQEDLAAFLAGHQVEVTASLPCYLEENVEQQRGKGAHGDSITALRLLNSLGYGTDPDLPLNLVYNPVGPVLPPPQQSLEADYQRELAARFGVRFNALYTLANLPISRFGAVLMAQGQYDAYMRLLRDNFSAGNLASLMCRSLLSVDWQGYLYDCDFNQMLALPMRAGAGPGKLHIREVEAGEQYLGMPVVTGEHCYGCAAGQGSSCGGALGE